MPFLENLREPTPNFSQKLQKKKIVEKASSGMGEMCPKILGGYEYYNPPDGVPIWGRMIGIDPGFHQFRKKLFFYVENVSSGM